MASDGNYAQATSEPVSFTIEKSACELEMETKAVSYTGEPVSVDVTACDEYGNEIPVEGVECFYRDSLNPESVKTTEPPTEAGIYYVWAARAEDVNYEAAVSKVRLLTIKPADVTVTVSGDFVVPYTGKRMEPEEIFETTVTSETGVDVSKQTEVQYIFYQSDKGGTRTEVPAHPGTYYVKAVAKERPNYHRGESELLKFKIDKAKPRISVSTGDITYGQETAQSVITGTAIGVNGETLEGSFSLNGDICHQTLDAGTYEVEVIFDPSGTDSENYESSKVAATLTVNPAPVEIELCLEDNTFILKGTLRGMFDDPTGTIAIYQKRSDDESGAYELLMDNVEITKQNGAYGFNVKLRLAEKGIYNFKTVHREGEKKNYIIAEETLNRVNISEIKDIVVPEDENLSEEANGAIDTNDHARPLWYLILMVAGIAGIVFVVKRKYTGR